MRQWRELCKETREFYRQRDAERAKVRRNAMAHARKRAKRQDYAKSVENSGR